MACTIHGIGAAVPPHTMSQAEATALAQQVICRDPLQQRLVGVLYRKAGVENRYTALPHQIALEWLPPAADGAGDGSVAIAETLGPTTAERMRFYAEHAPPLAIEAAERALNNARVAADEITHLVNVTCTGFAAPGVDIALISGLKLRPTTQRVQVGFMGCHGAINGLRVVHAIASADPTAKVLLCAVELCSLHYRFRWDPERIVANALFGDGAAALVASSQPAADAWTVRATGSMLLPDSQDAMSWNVGDHGFEMTLDARVPELIHAHLRPWLGQWLQTHGLRLDDVKSWAIHPGGPRILSAIEETLELSRDVTDVSREILAAHGNMSSPTVLFIVNRLRERQAPRPCVALGFGPGLVAEAALLGP